MSHFTKTGTRRVFRQPDGALLGNYEAVATVTFITEERGAFTLEIEAIDAYEEGGLWFEVNAEGKSELVDYDGSHALSDMVIELLEEQGVIVDNDFK